MTLNDLKWPLGDLCGKSWPLITKITILSDSLTPKTCIKWCHLSFWYFLIFYLFSGVSDFQGAGKIHSVVEKIGSRNFCVLWTLKGHKKQKLENEHENLAEGNFCKNDLKWPLGDLCGKSWPLITKITILSDSLTPKTCIKWCHLSFWYFLIFYLFSGVSDFQGAGKIHSEVEKIGQRAFCVLWTLKGHKKQKLENDHENPAEGNF